MGFVFATCQPGYEAALKADVARARAELRLAYSRPGLLTFKNDTQGSDDVARPSAWARVWGSTLARAAEGEDLLERIPPEIRRLHVFARDAELAGASERVVAVRDQLLASQRFAAEPRAAPGDWIADVIVAPGEPTLLGVHRHGPLHSPWPGGELPVAPPAFSPSRAYHKLEQAIAWAELPLRPGEKAVEIGSAPGGAAYALACRGISVWGVDPGAMDARVLAFVGPLGARVQHVSATLADVRWEQLPRDVAWLLCDVNLAPPVALHGLARLTPAFQRSLRGAVVTLKMNDEKMRASAASFADRLRGLGFARVELTHLPANRNELCAVALR